MQQLWLLGKRIDSIRQLRALFSAADAETVDTACLRMLEHCRSGALRQWLKRQGENQYLTDTQLREAVALLHREGEALTGDQLTGALAQLCGVPAECYQSPWMHARLRRQSDDARQRMERLRQQGWWSEYEELFLGVTDWSLVITDNTQLQLALEALRGTGQGNPTLYLCNTGTKLYTLDLRNLRGVTVVGIAGPRVVHRRLPEGQVIDAGAQGLVLRDLTLDCPGWEYVIRHEALSRNFTLRVL